MGDFIAAMFLGGAVVALYFLPWISAGLRHHRNSDAIGLMNLFLGWTVIAWIVALIWAFTDNIAKPTQHTS